MTTENTLDSMELSARTEIPLETETEIAPAKWWKAKRAKNVMLITVGAAILLTIGWWFYFYPYTSTDDARVAMTLLRLAPSYTEGRVTKVNVEEGSLVKEGDILVEIDHRIPEANYIKAKAQYDLASRELERIEKLTANGSATEQALDRAKSALAEADSELKMTEVILENTYIKSPVDGIVIQKRAEVGNILEKNQVGVVVADVKNAWIAANIEETSVGSVKIGQKVHISIDEGGELEGTVSEVRASVASQFALIPSDSGAGNFTKVVQRVPIKIQIENGDKESLRAGQSVEIKIRVH